MSVTAGETESTRGIVWFGLFFEDLCRFSDISPISRLGAGDNQSLKIQVARPGSKPGPLAPLLRQGHVKPKSTVDFG